MVGVPEISSPEEFRSLGSLKGDGKLLSHANTDTLPYFNIAGLFCRYEHLNKLIKKTLPRMANETEQKRRVRRIKQLDYTQCLDIKVNLWW